VSNGEDTEPEPAFLSHLLFLSPAILATASPNPDMEESEGRLSKPVAVIACIAMTLFYVAILYAPTLILRLPPPQSYENFMIRRFICAAFCSVASVIFCALVLPWQAMVFPLFLTSLMYAGSLMLKSMLLVNKWKEHRHQEGEPLLGCIKSTLLSLPGQMSSVASNVLFWRNFIVAPVTEELVFRACMIPLLLCGGFKAYNAIFLCPTFFSLAHLNHMMEIYSRHNYSLLKASLVVETLVGLKLLTPCFRNKNVVLCLLDANTLLLLVTCFLGLQLGYTVVFGSYASFLFIRTGNIVAPLVAHAFCNYMGLPVLFVHG
ncbi:hypothetical protein Goklo_012650, partial [Gossypium klotzschianum]|nr:hypothetical protein [Gossypium klotzschianum]